MSRATLDRWESTGSFPKRIQLGVNKIGWHKDEIDKWVEEKMANR